MLRDTVKKILKQNYGGHRIKDDIQLADEIIKIIGDSMYLKSRSALQVIYTWAAYDREQGLLAEDRALHNKHVMELCEKALNG